jgi:hypothetical protein
VRSLVDDPAFNSVAPLRLHGAVEGLVRRRGGLVVFEGAIHSCRGGDDCRPWAGHPGGSLQSVSEAGEAIHTNYTQGSVPHKRISLFP